MCSNEGKHLVFIKRYSFAWCKIIGTNYHLVVTCRTVADIAREVCDDPVGNILYICGSCLHIRIVHRSKHLRKVVCRHCHCIFCVDLLAVDDILYRLVIIIIFKHHHVYLKDLSVCFAHLPECLVINALELFCCRLLGLGNSFLFSLAVFCVNTFYSGILLFEY